MAIPPRIIRGTDVTTALGDAGTQIPASALPFGTTAGTVADGAAVTAVQVSATNAVTQAAGATAIATDASTAVSGATTAATAAAASAANALSVANAASAGIATATSAAAAAVVTANAASASVGTVTTTAASALTAANAANATANTAQTTASVAGTAASTAQTTANSASAAAAVAAASATSGLAAAAVADARSVTATATANTATNSATVATNTANTALTQAQQALARVNAIANISIDGTGFHAIMADGSIQNFIPNSITPPPTTPSVYTLASALTSTALPHMILSLDAALTAGVTAVGNTTPGIQIDGTGNVLSLVEPIGLNRANSGYGRTKLVTNGAGGFPFFHSMPDGYNNAYDSLVLSPSLGTQMFGPSGGTWTVIMVNRMLGPNASGLMTVRAASGEQVLVLGTFGTDGALRLEQNNGAAAGSEASNASTALNQWQILTITCDGTRLALYRNGVQAMVTATGVIGGFDVAPAVFEFLNNAQNDTSLIEVATGVPSITQHNARIAALGTRYNITVSAVTVGSATPIAPVPVDLTATYLRTINFPVNDTLPTFSGGVPSDGVGAAGTFTQIYDARFGTAAGNNIQTAQAIRDEFYLNHMVGSQVNALDIVASTGTTTPAYPTRARHYAIGDPNDLHVLATDHLKLKSISSKNGTDVSAIRSAMLRNPVPFKPGQYMEIDGQMPLGFFAWAALWGFTGLQKTPGPGNDPYSGTGRLFFAGDVGSQSQETDYNDFFVRAGVAMGKQVNFLAPDIYGKVWATAAPSIVWAASGSGYVWHSTAGPPYVELPAGGVNLSTGFHRHGINWRNDGTHIIDMLIDGQVVMQLYHEYSTGNYTDGGAPTQLPMHSMITNQAGATFSPGGTGGMIDNDGLVDGWTFRLRRWAQWNGNITSPNSLRATA